MPPTIVDLDDFCEPSNSLPLLDQLKRDLPGFVVTLFVVPGLSTPGWLREICTARPWIEIVPHGWFHQTSRECQHWDRMETYAYLRYLERFETELAAPGSPVELQRGFKAPGWQISDTTLEVLAKEGYWVADQPNNRHRRPRGLRVYELNHPSRIHGHIGHLGGYNPNELSLIAGLIRGAPGPFDFVRNHLDVTR
jgi:hypothetical protein